MKHDLKPVRVYHVNDGGGYFDQMDDYADPNHHGANYYYRDDVDALLEGIGGGWIKCSERMPEPGEFVIGWHRRWKMPVQLFLGRDGSWFYVNAFSAPAPSHWQPLPEPPND